MSEFLTGEKLGNAIYDIIWDANNTLLMVSPYIKLDDYFKKLLDKHENNPKIHIILVFGKNEKNIKNSLSQTDFEYFKKFPFVSVIYVPNLHGKYYGNEKKGIITSINLYDYSFKNNIEFGIYSEQSILNKFSKSADNEAWNYCWEIADENEVVFISRPVYEKQKMLINLGKKYIKSDTLFDSTDKFYGIKGKNKSNFKRLADFPNELEFSSANNGRPMRILEEKAPKFGYCIRTGEKIPFNPKQPMSKNAWKAWNKYADANFPENYCHKTGKESYKKTTMNNPILN